MFDVQGRCSSGTFALKCVVQAVDGACGRVRRVEARSAAADGAVEQFGRVAHRRCDVVRRQPVPAVSDEQRQTGSDDVHAQHHQHGAHHERQLNCSTHKAERCGQKK